MTITPRIVTEGTFDDYFFDLMRGIYPINGVTFEGYREDFYSDALGIPTVGTGTALIFKDDTTYSIRSDLSTIFSGAYTFSSNELNTLNTIVSQLNANNVSGAENTLINAKGSGQFTDLMPAQVRTIFDNALAENLNTVSNNHMTAWANIQTNLAGSYELAAVYSLLTKAPGLVGPGLVDALTDGDRARAWYEILYNHEAWNNAVSMNRHEAEADLFALVNTNADEAEIALELNTLFNGTDYSNNDIYSRIQARDTHKPLETKIATYLQDVQDYYAEGNAIDYIQIADGEWIQAGTITAKSASGKDSANTDNLIIGSDSNDVLNGLGGNDYLIGGLGSDTLNGGEGFDTANFFQESSALTVDVASSGNTTVSNGTDTDSLSGIERLILTDHDDVVNFTGNNFFGSGVTHIDGGGTADNDTINQIYYLEDFSCKAHIDFCR